MAYGAYEYRQQSVLGGSPVHLVVMAYDVAIQACEQVDHARAIQAVSLLRDALNFDYPEAAVGLFRLYQWTLECLRARNYPGALAVLKPLREAWATVENQQPAVGLPMSLPERSSVLYAA
jgi:flagellin-specific chaperone FliS